MNTEVAEAEVVEAGEAWLAENSDKNKTPPAFELPELSAEDSVDLYAEGPVSHGISDSGSLKLNEEELESAERRQQMVESSAIDLSSNPTGFDLDLASAKSGAAGRSPGAPCQSARTSSPSTGVPWAGTRRRYSPATSLHLRGIGRPSTDITTRSASATRRHHHRNAATGGGPLAACDGDAPITSIRGPAPSSTMAIAASPKPSR